MKGFLVIFMSIKYVDIKDLILDEENPRFILQDHFEDEEDIFNYLKENDNIMNVVESIFNNGFIQIGERPIVTYSNNKYLVLEGNRRIGAIKFLHGFYKQKYNKDISKELLDKTKTIEVDLVESREDGTRPLILRHVSGIEMWKPESKRKFYTKHYIKGKTLTEIDQMSPEKLTEIKRYLRQGLYLDYVSSYVYGKKIDNPSLVYERMYQQFKKIGLHQDLQVPEKYADFNFTLSDEIVSLDESNQFIKGFIKIYNEDKKITSRDVNTIESFDNYLNNTLKSDDNKLYDLYQKIVDSKSKKDDKVSQKKSFFYENDPLVKLEDLFYLPVRLFENEIVIYDSKNEIVEYNLCNFKIGKYKFNIDKESYSVEVKEKLTPRINQISKVYEMFSNNPFDLKSVLQIKDSYDRNLDWSNPNLTLISQDATIKGSILTPKHPGIIELDISYKLDDLVISENFKFDAKIKSTDLTSNRVQDSYFCFKFVKINYTKNPPVSEQLIKEINQAYLYKFYTLIASALRSSIETAIYELIQDSIINNLNTVLKFENDWFKKTILILSSIATRKTQNGKYIQMITDFCNKNQSISTYHDMQKYFNINLNENQVSYMLDTLHLGAHKSLTIITKENIDKLKDTVTSIIELINLIKIYNYPI